MGATATPGVEQIDDAVLAGYQKRPAEWLSAPDFDLDNAIGNLALYVQERFFPR